MTMQQWFMAIGGHLRIVLFDPREAIPVELEHDNRLFVVSLDRVLAIFRRSDVKKPSEES